MGSSSGRFLLGLLLGILCGGGLVTLLRGPASPSVKGAIGLSPGDSTSLSPARAEEGGDLPAVASSAQREVARPTPDAALRATKVSDAEVKELVAQVSDVSATRQEGGGAIYGRVVDQDDKGLAGVVVRLQVNESGRGASAPSSVATDAPELDSLEKTVRRAAERFSASRANLIQATTDASGAYRCEGLPDRKWTVRAYRAGYEVVADVSAYSIRTDNEVGFTATRVIEVATQVHQPDGALAQGAYLQCARQGQNRRNMRYAWSPAEDFLRLTPGDYEITAYSDEGSSNQDAELSSEAQEVSIEAGASAPALRFDLRGRLGIRGVVRTANAKAETERMYVHAMPLAPLQEVDLGLLSDSDQRESVRIGEEFAFLDLEPGRFVVGVSRSWRSPIVAHQVVEVSASSVTCDLELPPVDLSRSLRVWVLGPDGKNVDRANFSMRVKRGNSSSSGGVDDVRDDDGSYLVAFAAKNEGDYFGDASTKVEFQLQVSAQDYGSRTIDLVRGQTELTVTFTVPGTLEATVAGYQGSGYEGRLSVQAVKAEGGQTRFYSSHGHEDMNADGVQTIESLEPGSYRVTLNATPKGSPDEWYRTSEIDSVELEILPGPNSVQLRIPPLYAMRVHWADGKEGANMSLRPYENSDNYGNNRNSEIDASGYASFSELKAGDYILQVWGGSVSQMQVTIPCGDIEFEPMALDALRVMISDANGDLAKLGFQNGDMIVGADGKEFEGDPDYQLFTSLTQSKTAEVTFIVERAGKRLEITAKGSDVGDWNDMGGRFEPAKR